MPFKLHLKVDQLPKSLNTKLRNHWSVQRKESRAWALLINLLASGQLPEKPLERATLHLIRHHYRALDYDGLVGSFKPVVDALVTCGVIADDSWRVTGPWACQQFMRPKAEGPLIEIIVSEITFS